MTGKQIRNYIENELGCEPVHEVDVLAEAIADVAYQLENDEQVIILNAPNGKLYYY